MRSAPAGIQTSLAAAGLSSLRSFGRRRENDRRFARQHPKRERFLQIKTNDGIRMAEITDGYIRSEAELEITATTAQYKRAMNRRSPNDIAVNDAFSRGVRWTPDALFQRPKARWREDGLRNR